MSGPRRELAEEQTERLFGIGCSLLPSQLGLLDEVRDLVGVVELSPELFCDEVEADDGTVELRLVPALLDPVLQAIGELPLIVHGLELSIGSVSGWNPSALAVLDAVDRRAPFEWHSEHLGFLTTADAQGRVRHAGIPLPLPFTSEAVDLVAARARSLRRRFGRPFLLENAAYYLPDLPADAGWDEATFLAELVRRSDCDLLLDLFNLYVNCVNYGRDPLDLLGRMPLERVVEIHVAGGDEELGFVLDSHSAAVPEDVWDLLGWVLERSPRVGAVVFEVLDQAFPRIGRAVYLRQLERAADIWSAAGRRSA